MPSPTTSLATQRPDLAGSFMEFDLEMQRRGFVAHRCLPVIEVAKQAGTFGKIPVEQLLKTVDTKRAPGGGYNRDQYTFGTDTYATEEHGHEEPIDDRESHMYAEYFDAEQVAAMRAFEMVLAAAERRVSALMFNATTFSSQKTTVTNEWDDLSNATPIANVETAVQAVYGRTGLWPNALVINKKVFRNLRNCSEIRDRLTASGAGSRATAADIGPEDLASIFDLDEVIVAGTSKNTAKEGQSASLSPNWSDEYAMVFIKPTSNDIRQPCLGRTFHWSEDGSEVGGQVETYRDETVRADIVRVRHDVDEKLIFTEAAQLLDNITT